MCKCTSFAGGCQRVMLAEVSRYKVTPDRSWVTGSIDLLIVMVEGLEGNLALPVVGESGCPPEEQKDTDDKRWQDER